MARKKGGIGIPLSLDADETTFTRALRAISAESKKTTKEVNEIDKALVLNPNSTILLNQKQQMLAKSISDTKNALVALQAGKAKADAEMANGVEKNQEQYRKLEREILNTANNLKNLNAQASGNTLAKPLDNAATSAKKFDSSIDNAKTSTKQLNSEVTKTSTQANKLSSAMSTAVKGVAAGYTGKALVEYLIGSNAQMEQYTTSFEVLLGSASKSKALMSDLTDFAAKTPLEMTDVTKQANQLLNYGIAADDVVSKLQKLGDLSGGQAQKLEAVTRAYGQMTTNGKVSLEDLNQMTEAGVPMLQALADTAGKSTSEIRQMITDGKIGMPQLNAAIDSLTTGTGKFAGMMEKQSKTMNGMISTLKDNFAQFGRDVGEETFGEVKGALTDVMTEIDRMKADGSLKEIEEDLGNALASIVKLMVEIGKNNTWVETAKGIGEFASAITTVSEAVESLKGKSKIFSELMKLVDETVNPFVRLSNANDKMLESFNKDVDRYKDNKAGLELLGLEYDKTTNKIIRFNGVAGGGSTSHISTSGTSFGGGGGSFDGSNNVSPYSYMEANAKANMEANQGTAQIEDAFKSRQAVIDTKHDQGKKSDSEYYAESKALLAEYATDETGIYSDYFTKLYTLQNSMEEKAKSALSDSQKEKAEVLKAQFERNEITEEEYYSKLETLAKTWGKNGTEYLTEVYKGRKELAQKSAEDELKTWETGFDKIADSAKTAFDDINKQQEDMANKLADTTELFKRQTVGEKDNVMVLSNIDEQTQKLKLYDEALKNLKSAGASKDFMSEVTSMGVDDALDYSKNLLDKPQDELQAYLASWQENKDTANQIASDYYADDANTLKTEFTDKIKNSLAEMPASANLIGQDTASEFVKGMKSKLAELNTSMNLTAQQAMTATVKTSSTAANGTAGGNNQNVGTISNVSSPPIQITVQSVLDGKVIGETATKYINAASYAQGRSVVK